MTPLCEITRQWIGTPYGKTTCIGFVHDFLEQALGRPVPDTFGALSIKNYYDKWLRDRAAVEKQMCQAVQAYTTPSNIKFPALFDVVVVKLKGGGLMPAVYVGGGNAMACFTRQGVKVFELDRNHKIILAGALK